MKLNFRILFCILFGLTVLFLLILYDVQSVVAFPGDFESCSVQNGRDDEGEPNPNRIPESECLALKTILFK